MKAYIQIKENGDWLNENCYASAEGFHRMGYDIKKFKLEDTKPFFGSNHAFTDFDTREDIAHGGIIGMRNLFNNFGVPQPEIHNPHEHLYDYLGREMSETTFGEVIKSFEYHFQTPIFIKPLIEHKLFTGKVINSFSDLISLAGTPNETKLLQSEVVTYISEYRCFVNRRSLLGCKNYTGDFTVLPNFDLVYGAINDYKEQPLSYSLDFGITDKGETQLIEINDGFALGAYGLNSIYYCKFIRDRWHEIINTKNK
jgi:hypothetical protein